MQHIHCIIPQLSFNLKYLLTTDVTLEETIYIPKNTLLKGAKGDPSCP